MPTHSITGAALASAFVLKGERGTLFSVACEIDPSAPTATYYLLLLHAASIPADGAVDVIDSVAVDHVSGTRDYPQLDLGEAGVASTVGFVVALSTTRPAKTTPGGSYLWLEGGNFS